MRVSSRVTDEVRWAITEQGRYDLIMLPTCQCDPRLPGLLVTCTRCGTVYGHVSELSVQSYSHKTRRD